MPAKKMVHTKNIIEIVPININHDGRLLNNCLNIIKKSRISPANERKKCHPVTILMKVSIRVILVDSASLCIVTSKD